MKLKLITDLATLQANADRWDRVAGEFPFLSWGWMESWIKNQGKGLQLAVLVGIDTDDNWIGVAPWCIDEQNNMTRKLRWLSSGQACGDYLNLLAAPDQFSAFAEAAVDWLSDNIGAGKSLGKLDSIELEGVSLADPDMAYLNELLIATGFQQHATDLEGCWAVDLPASWQDLNCQLSKSMRRKTKKAVNRLADSETEIRSSDDFPLDDLWQNFVTLHQKRRQMLGQAGCFADSDFERFLFEATAKLVASGNAELIEIRSQAQPLASMVLFNDQETVYMYQSGMCEQRVALEPGYQMAACAISRSIEKGYRHFDFLRGDEPYKARWNTERVALTRLKFIPRTISAQLKHSLWLTGKSIKGCVAGTSSD